MSYTSTARAYSGFRGLGTVAVRTERVADARMPADRTTEREPISGGDDLSLPPDYRRLPDPVRDPIPSRTALDVAALLVPVRTPSGGTAVVTTQPQPRMPGVTRIDGIKLRPTQPMLVSPVGPGTPGGTSSLLPRWPGTPIDADTTSTGLSWWKRRTNAERVGIAAGGVVLAILVLRGIAK